MKPSTQVGAVIIFAPGVTKEEAARQIDDLYAIVMEDGQRMVATKSVQDENHPALLRAEWTGLPLADVLTCPPTTEGGS